MKHKTYCKQYQRYLDRVKADPKEKARRKEVHKEWRKRWLAIPENLARLKAYTRWYHNEHYDDLRYSVMAIYSEGKPRCSCCGEDIIEFLTFDHIDGHPKKRDRGLYRDRSRILLTHWIIQNNFPEDIRVLCYNCNCGRSHHDVARTDDYGHGRCPHELIRRGDHI